MKKATRAEWLERTGNSLSVFVAVSILCIMWQSTGRMWASYLYAPSDYRQWGTNAGLTLLVALCTVGLLMYVVSDYRQQRAEREAKKAARNEDAENESEVEELNSYSS